MDDRRAASGKLRERPSLDSRIDASSQIWRRAEDVCGSGGREFCQFGFLNRLSKMARASVALLGAGTLGAMDALPLAGAASRATVTRGLKSSHSLDASLGEIRTGTGFRH